MDEKQVVDVLGMVNLLITGARSNGAAALHVARALGRTLPYDHHAINHESRWSRISWQVFESDSLEDDESNEDPEPKIPSRIEIKRMSSEDRRDQ